MENSNNYPEEIIVGSVVGVRGVKGELKVRPETDNPKRFKQNSEIWVDSVKYVIEKSEYNSKKNLIYLNIGLNTRNSAELKIGKLITIPISMLPDLDKGSYYHFQIIGLKVFDEMNNKIGEVVDILPNQNNDNYVIKDNQKKEIIIPSKSEWIKKIDICNNIIVIRLPEYI